MQPYLRSFNRSTFKSKNKNAKTDINLMSMITILINKESDAKYAHSPQQHPIEFICFIGNVISLWTFSAISMYAYGKRFYRRNQNQNEKMEEANETANDNLNKMREFIKKKSNGKISSLETKFKKLIKVIKIRKENQMIRITPDDCA